MSSTLDLFSLKGRTALITGATRGIGQALALALAEAGADVVLIQRDSSNTTTKQEIEKLGRKATIYHADLGKADEVRGVAKTVLDDGHDIDILVNCGGVQRRHPAHEFPDSDWDEVLQVNLSTVFALCRDVGAYMLTRKPNGNPPHRGSIINIASLTTFQGAINIPAYAASKGGVGQLTKALSNQWTGYGINCNAIAPGYVQTDLTAALHNDEKTAASLLERIPAGRWGLPDDFKGSIVYLASRASLYVSGEILTVDGGWMGR
ncbi:hypothetical protein LTR85_010114 [Meristemomyces frigidus]|nr:hypothetical protein LTR85_010114 [Meristemomyces frigidus]